MTGVLVIMGSGETAPTMVKPHREIFRRCGDRPAVLLDTPYGFQENADDISRRAVKYFGDSTGRSVSVAGWRTTPPPGLDRERALAGLRAAGWLFAGPGSPTYALRQWTGTEIPAVLSEALTRDAVVLFASAAALTLNSHTIPVYEIYKVGADPTWVPGLDLIHPMTGLQAVVIPHYDNAEGGHHDTRYCYLGERRLAALESELPPGTFILGVDEHTAAIFDPSSETITVLGNGGLTLRRAGASRWWPTGSVVPYAALTQHADPSTANPTLLPHPDGSPAAPSTLDGSPAAAISPGGSAVVAISPGGSAVVAASSDGSSAGPAGTSTAAPPWYAGRPAASSLPATSLGAETSAAVARFDACFEARDPDGCVAAALDLEQAMHDWLADTDVSDERDQARAALRRMLLRLGSLAAPDRLTPLVNALVQLRTTARDAKDWPLSDALRDVLQEAAGVTVRDTSTGPEITFPPTTG